MKNQLDINPQTKVGEMLETYPLLEEVLLELSPTFAKLKNPILRKTVARVVSLRQAAEIGGIDVGTMVSKLRHAASLNTTNEDMPIYLSDTIPEWVAHGQIVVSFDVIYIIEGGGSPMKDILEKAGQLSKDEVMELITPFAPLPIIDLLISKNYECYYIRKEDQKVYTYIQKM